MTTCWSGQISSRAWLTLFFCLFVCFANDLDDGSQNWILWDFFICWQSIKLCFPVCSCLLRPLHHPVRIIAQLSHSRFDEVPFKSGASAVSLGISASVSELLFSRAANQYRNNDCPCVRVNVEISCFLSTQKKLKSTKATQSTYDWQQSVSTNPGQLSVHCCWALNNKAQH